MIRVFVSSVSLGLEASRKQIISDLQTAGYDVGAMERFGAQPRYLLMSGHLDLQRSRELTRGCSLEVDQVDSSAAWARKGQARFARHLR
jgi:hypothetical protein